MIGGLIFFAAGAALSAASFFITRRLLASSRGAVGAVFVLRQAIDIAFLAALYFLSGYLPWSSTGILIGGALGITLPMLVFTPMLLRTIKTGETAKTDKKGDDKENV